MNRFGTLIIGALAVSLQACAGCDDETTPPPPAISDDCVIAPEIVRTEFTPKEGRVPVDVVFNVLAEDRDEKFCNEKLTFHFDFDGDGEADLSGPNGDKVGYRYDVEGQYPIFIWVSDSSGHISKKIKKFVTAKPNRPPYITRFYAAPSVGKVPLDVTYSWTAGDPDPDTPLELTLDLGDGVAIAIDPEKTSVYSTKYRQPGQFTAVLRVCDERVCVQRSLEITASIEIERSSFMQTVGQSVAIAFNDNEGRHWTGPGGPYDLAYVASGAIPLKVLRYPLDAFAYGAAGPPVELIGMADPDGRGTAGWSDVVAHENLVLTGGSDGLHIYSVGTDPSNQCAGPWDTDCYPGTPTQPVAYCFQDRTGVRQLSTKVAKLDLFRYAGGTSAAANEMWAVAAVEASLNMGGLVAVRLDPLTRPGGVEYGGARHGPLATGASYAYEHTTGVITVFVDIAASVRVGDIFYHVAGNTPVRIQAIDRAARTLTVMPDPVLSNTGNFRIDLGRRMISDCWQHGELVREKNYSGNIFKKSATNYFGRVPLALAIDGDFAYVGLTADGFRIVDLKAWADGGFGASPPIAYQLLGGDAKGIALTHAEPVTAALAPGRFSSYATIALGTKNYADCDDRGPVSLTGDKLAGDLTGATLAALHWPGNRLVLRAGGLSVTATVVSRASDSIRIEPRPSDAFFSAAVSGFTYGITTSVASYAILHKYPGSGPVTIATPQAGAVARNSRCPNFLNAYELITEPVTVEYVSAPLAFVTLGGGIVALDRTNPRAPVILNDQSSQSRARPASPAANLVVHGTHLLAGGGYQGQINVFDASNPRHFAMGAVQFTGTFRRQGTPPPWDFSINEMHYRKPLTEHAGVVIVAGGRMGVQALYLADHIDTLVARCGNILSEDSKCMAFMPALQLRHEGKIRRINVPNKNYAYLAQERGGVLVLDISQMQNDGDPFFVSHVRTPGDPADMRLVTDSTTAEPLEMLVADSSSLFRVPMTDPAAPGVGGVWMRPGSSGYACVSHLEGETFLCFRDSTGMNGWYFGAQSPGATLGVWNRYLQTAPDAENRVCKDSYVEGSAPYLLAFSRLVPAKLANRLFFFVEPPLLEGSGKLWEVQTDAQGRIRITDDGAGGAMARVCQWRSGGFGKFLSYQESRHGEGWKRLYTLDVSGGIKVYDIDGFEDKLATDPTFDVTRGPTLMGSLSLHTLVGKYPVSTQMNAVGQYVFVGTYDAGGFVINATNPLQPVVIGQTKVAAPGVGLNVSSMNAVAFETVPGVAETGYTYIAIISDDSNGGVQLLRFVGLLPP